MRQTLSKVWKLPFVVLTMVITGCAGNQSTDESDPHESMNRVFYNVNDSIDRNFLQPVARGYVKVTPDPVREGITNFFDNVSYINVIMNDLMQGKGGQFLQDSGRFLVNSTVGVGGLFDPAGGLGLKQHDEDLGQTFGVWGMGEGAYLTLPLLGPSSYRDLPDMASAMFLNPLTYLNPVVTIPAGLVNAVNKRANLLEATRIRDQAALDPYVFVREAYRQQREFKIYDGNPPGEEFDEYMEGEGDAAILRIY